MPKLPRGRVSDAGSALSVIRRTIVVLWERVATTYRPEKHYMQGPGPKCRRKRARVLSFKEDI